MLPSSSDRSAFRRFAPVRSDSTSAVSSLSIASTRWSMSEVCSVTLATCSRERSTASCSVRSASRSASVRMRGGLLLGVALDRRGALLGGLDDRPDLLGGRLGQRGAAAALGLALERLELVGQRARCSSTASGS